MERKALDLLDKQKASHCPLTMKKEEKIVASKGQKKGDLQELEAPFKPT